MTDLFEYFSTDLTLSATGDLLVASDTDETTQRVLRRLMTNPTQYDSAGNVSVPGDYLWHPGYGAGLPAYVGRTLDTPSLIALIKSQMYQEAGVAHDPEPQIAFQQIPNGLSVQISYTNANTGLPAYLSFTVTP